MVTKTQAPPSNAIVKLQAVTKVYEMGNAQVHALAGVSVAFERRSFYAIMGPSGSGKSTMLNLLGCLDRPTSGDYLLEGRNVADLDDDALSDIRLRKLGFIFQSFNLVPQLTVRENIELPLSDRDLGGDHSTQRAEELAELVGLDDRLNHRPSELSGGQQQRVAVARALANDPPILLADEPTGNLDSATGVQIMQLLAQLNAVGKTIIMVTHEPDIAQYASHRVHMRDGLIEHVEDNA